MRDLENDVVPLLATAPRLCDIRGERGAAAPSRVLTRILLLRAHSSLSVLPLCKGTFQLFSTFFSKRYRSGCFDRWISIFIPPLPRPLYLSPSVDYRNGGEKKMSRNLVDEFPVDQESRALAPSSPLVASSRGEKNMRNIIQELGRERGRGRKLARGEWGEGRRGAAVAELRACVRVGRVSERCSSGRME